MGAPFARQGWEQGQWATKRDTNIAYQRFLKENGADEEKWANNQENVAVLKDSLTLLSDDIDPFASEFLTVSPKKVKAITNWLHPSRIEDVERLLATTVFIREHLSPRYSHFSKSLRDIPCLFAGRSQVGATRRLNLSLGH